MLDSYVKDMDMLIGELSDAADSCRGIVSYGVLTAMDEVVNEWISHTKPIIEELIKDHEKLEELSSSNMEVEK